ncbi:hypothetical protein Mapa_004946 [Marchantia paleacea]|nr:hypothetical protein Mapa_004946 [Marchantia paleacea]
MQPRLVDSISGGRRFNRNLSFNSHSGEELLWHTQVLDFQLAGLEESLSSLKVNTESTFTIETRNLGKKMHIYYDDFYFSVQWKHVNMGHGKAAGFDQGTKNTTYIHGSFRSSPANVELEASQQAELADARNRGMLSISIDVDVRTQWKDISGLKSDKFDARIECKVSINPQIASGSQLLFQQCEVLDFKCLAGC